MEDDPTTGFRKLNFLLSNPPFPPETFGNLLLLHCKYGYHELAADILAENRCFPPARALCLEITISALFSRCSGRRWKSQGVVPPFFMGEMGLLCCLIQASSTPPILSNRHDCPPGHMSMLCPCPRQNRMVEEVLSLLGELK